MNLTAIQSLQVPDEATVSAGPQRALAMAQSFVIETQDDYALAADELKAVKSKYKLLDEKRTGLVKPLNDVVKGINDLFRAPLAALEQAEACLKGSMLGYSREQERIAAEARRVAEAEAAAERQRLEAEARAIAEAERERQRIADEAARTERLRLEAEAKAAYEAGDAFKAAEALRLAEESAALKRAQDDAAAQAAAQAEAAIRATAQVVTAAAVAPAIAKVQGISSAKSVDFEVNDLLALVQHVAQHPELIGLLKSDDTKIRSYVKGLGMACKLPGIHVFEKTTLRA